MAGRNIGAARGRLARVGATLFALLCLGGFALMPGSSAAFSATTTGPASSFAARATFGLSQTAPCFSDNGTGSCTAAAGISEGASVVVSPDGKNVYVGSIANSAVASFSRNATTGALTRLAGTTGCHSNGTLAGCTKVPGVLGAVSDLSISPDGKNVYAVGYNSSTVAEFSRNATTGALTLLSSPNGCLYDNGVGTPPAGCTAAWKLSGADGVVVSPDGAYVYVTAVGSNSLTVFARNATTGVLTQVSGTAGCYTNTAAPGCTTVYGLVNPYYLRTSPDGTSVYVAAYAGSAVAIFQRNMTTGVLTQPAGPNACVYDNTASAITNCTVVSGISGAYHVDVAPDGRTVYAAGRNGSTVAAFTRNTSTGVLTQVASPNRCAYIGSAVTGCTAARAISQPTGIEFSSDGLFAFVTSAGSHGVAVFRHNSSTGVLTQLTATSGCISTGTAGCTTGIGLSTASAIAISPDDRDVYVVGGSGRGYVAVLNLTH
ncbi:beta-propeller fold lactonase family protein [Actinoplanes sp. NPDC051475]|uniref:lactonase family protein n=1 Tax=Actinoplanes sp. NPDC051475 TaxID=3157225 RepID=UPI00344DEF1F